LEGTFLTLVMETLSKNELVEKPDNVSLMIVERQDEALLEPRFRNVDIRPRQILSDGLK